MTHTHVTVISSDCITLLTTVHTVWLRFGASLVADAAVIPPSLKLSKMCQVGRWTILHHTHTPTPVVMSCIDYCNSLSPYSASYITRRHQALLKLVKWSDILLMSKIAVTLFPSYCCFISLLCRVIDVHLWMFRMRSGRCRSCLAIRSMQCMVCFSFHVPSVRFQ